MNILELLENPKSKTLKFNTIDTTFGGFFGAGFAFILNYFYENNTDNNKNYLKVNYKQFSYVN